MSQASRFIGEGLPSHLRMGCQRLAAKLLACPRSHHLWQSWDWNTEVPHSPPQTRAPPPTPQLPPPAGKTEGLAVRLESAWPRYGAFPLGLPRPHSQLVRFALCLENPLTLPMAAEALLFATCISSKKTKVCD